MSCDLEKYSTESNLTLLCQAIARAWAQAGASGIVLAGREADTPNLTVENVANISESNPVMSVPTDVSDESSVKSLFEKVKDKFGKAHVLVNTAVTVGEGMMGDIPQASWWAAFVSCLL